MIKNIVFDLGNVIIRWDPNYIISQYTNNPKVHKELLEKIFASPYWAAYDDGSLTREEVIRNIQKTTSYKYNTIIVDIVYYWYQHCPMIEGVEDLVKELKKQGHNIYLLSNTNIHFDEYKETLSVMKYFDGYYISAKAKLIKPNREIYVDFLKVFHLQAEECIFIDDNKQNIKAAKKMGIHGYRFDGNIEALKSYITDRKIIFPS